MEVKKIGNIYGFTGGSYAGAVYSSLGLCPSINSMEGGNRQPMIVTTDPKVLGGLGEKKSNGGTQYFQQDRVYSSDGVAMSHPAQIPGGSYRYMIEKKTISTKGKEIDIASTILNGYHRTNITGFNADNGVMEKVKIKQATERGYIECKVGGVADLSYPSSKTRRGRVQDGGDVSPGLTVSGMDGLRKIESPYRIRKLTPRECWRLMGFTDEEFNKAAEVNSNTQLYKQAGNSIVVDVLVGIFGQIFEPADIQGQLTIFDLQGGNSE